MNTPKRPAASLLLLLLLVTNLLLPASAADTKLGSALSDTAAYLTQAVPAPQVGSIGGEWAVLGLARSGCTVPEGYYQAYYDRVADYVAQRDGVLHQRKYTEYSRLILALTAIGADARDVAGYDLTAPLSDYEATIWQGVNGPIYALLALDSGGYPLSQATRQQYIGYILSRQLPDGGWSLSGSTSDPDMTGMALQTLAKYPSQSAVAQAIDRALTCMSQQQSADGGFSSWGTARVESCAQMLVALCELGLSLDDPRFVKHGNTLLDGLLQYQTPDGGFRHALSEDGSSLMATEQAFYALVAVQRAQQGASSLYRMGDAAPLVSQNAAPSGLPGKHPDVTAQAVTQPSKAFSDLSGHPNQTAILALARRGLVSGMGDGTFQPGKTITRAEFSAMVVNALGLKPKAGSSFTDVPSTSWYAPYVGTAHSYEIVSGRGGGVFDPNGLITRQEGACMVANAAKLCGIDTQLSASTVRNILAQFPDYVTATPWAQSSLALCYRENILSQAELDIRPLQPITRGEMAQMIYNFLLAAQLV